MEQGKAVSVLYSRITEYLAGMFSSGVMTEQQATQTAGLMYVPSDIDRVGKLAMEVGVGIQDKIDKRYKYSNEAMKDLQKSLKLIQDMYQEDGKVLFTGDSKYARELTALCPPMGRSVIKKVRETGTEGKVHVFTYFNHLEDVVNRSLSKDSICEMSLFKETASSPQRLSAAVFRIRSCVVASRFPACFLRCCSRESVLITFSHSLH